MGQAGAPDAAARADDVRRRRDAFDDALARLDLDAAVVAGEANVTYLSGYLTRSWANRSRPIVLVVRRGMAPALVLSAGEAVRAQADGVDVEVEPYEAPVAVEGQLEFVAAAASRVRALLSSARARRIGLELTSHALPCLSPSAIGEIARAAQQVADVAPALSRLRMSKSAHEIECLRRAAAVLGDAFDAFAAAASPGMTERELDRAFTGCASTSGADRVGYTAVSAAVEGAALGGASDRVWEEGRLLLFDAGVVVDGYWADFCRIYAAGEASAAQRAAYAELVAALGRMRTVVRAGATAGDVVPAAGAGFFGRVGHGIGLDITEPPSLHPDDHTPLTEGMALCLEPNAATEAGFLAAEEEVVVSPSGATLISPPFPRGLEVIA